MDRIDVLIAHHSSRSFGASYSQVSNTVAALPLAPAYLAVRLVFWLTLGGFVGLVYSYGWLVR